MYANQRTFVDTSSMPTMAQLMSLQALNGMGAMGAQAQMGMGLGGFPQTHKAVTGLASSLPHLGPFDSLATLSTIQYVRLRGKLRTASQCSVSVSVIQISER